MRLALVLGGVALAAGLSATTQPRADSACPQATQMPYYSPLAYLTECLPDYCAAKVGREIKQGLRDTDMKLGDLNVQLELTSNSWRKFKRACRAINGDLTVVGPAMDAFSTASYDFSVNKGKLAEIYEALQQPNEDNVFVKMRSSRMRTLLSPACMAGIDKQVIDGLNAAQVPIDVEINCVPPAPPQQAPLGPKSVE
jgi:hypothetical protein